MTDAQRAQARELRRFDYGYKGMVERAAGAFMYHADHVEATAVLRAREAQMRTALEEIAAHEKCDGNCSCRSRAEIISAALAPQEGQAHGD